MNDIINKYAALTLGLKKVTGMWVSSYVRQGAALSACSIDGDPALIVGDIEKMTGAIKSHHAGLGAMRNHWRYLLAPTFLLIKADPLTLEPSLRHAKEIWKREKL